MKSSNTTENIQLDEFQAESKSLLDDQSNAESTHKVHFKSPGSRFVVTPASVTPVSTHTELNSDDYSDLLLRYVRENRLNKIKELFDVSHRAQALLAVEESQDSIRIQIDVQDEYRQTPLLIATRLNFQEV